MSKHQNLNVPLVELEHLSGDRIISIGTDLDDIAFNYSPQTFIAKFIKAADSRINRKGVYDELLRYLPDAKYEVESLEVEIPPQRRRLDEQAHTISLPLVKWQFNDGAILACLPTLGLAYHHKTSEDCGERLAEIVRLNFKRTKRFDSYQNLIASQWFEEPSVSNQEVSLAFYTPHELDEIAKGKEERILPKTASRMNRSLQKFFGMEENLEDLHRNLQGEFRQSVLIVGPSGCGKTALVHAYEQLVGRQWDQKPWMTSAARLIQVLTEQGAWQYGLGKWVNELKETGDVVFIGNLTEWFEVGQYSGNAVSIAEALRDPLQRNEILLIAEATEEQLNKIELRSPGYRNLFHLIEFRERGEEAENRIAVSAIKNIAELYGLSIDPSVINKILLLHRRYTPYSGYPGKTIRFFESLILQNTGSQSPIGESEALAAFCEESGMPRFLIDPGVPFELEKASTFFSECIIGQHRAVEELNDAILTTKAGMARSGKPIMSLLFVGPTGVGKTQLTKTLAKFIFGDERRMIRFDMSEYSDPDAIPRLTAAQDASLVSKVRQQPFSVILFDEIEKAAYNFFDLLLQVLGEGRLTDDRGDVANFCSTIIIMTSNLGAQEYMRPSMGFSKSTDNLGQHFEAAVTKHFRPELFNRLDRLVPFVPLTKEEKGIILRKEVEYLLKSEGISKRPLDISFSQAVWQFLESLEIDFRYGARAIQRELQKHIVWPLSGVLAENSQVDPLQIDIDCEDNAVIVRHKQLLGVKKTLGFFAQFVDRVSEERRLVQGLEEGSTWIGLQSEMDKLEQKKRRKKEKFWENANWVHRLDSLQTLATRYSEIAENIFDLEKTCLSQVKEESPDILWDDYQSQLKHYKEIYKNLLFDIESFVNRINNTLVFCIYGPRPLRDDFFSFYEALFATFKHNTTHYTIHQLKQPMSHEALIDAIQEDHEERLINTSAISASSKSDEPTLINYWISARNLSENVVSPIGEMVFIEGACAAHYYLNEKGVHEIYVDENAKAKLFIDVQTGNPQGYAVPEGVQRKEFYKTLKVARKIVDNQYTDTRFPDSIKKAVPLERHVEQVEKRVRESLLRSLIKTSKVKKDAND